MRVDSFHASRIEASAFVHFGGWFIFDFSSPLHDVVFGSRIQHDSIRSTLPCHGIEVIEKKISKLSALHRRDDSGEDDSRHPITIIVPVECPETDGEVVQVHHVLFQAGKIAA